MDIWRRVRAGGGPAGDASISHLRHLRMDHERHGALRQQMQPDGIDYDHWQPVLFGELGVERGQLHGRGSGTG